MQKDAEYVFTFYGPPIGTLCITIPLIAYLLIVQSESITVFTAIFIICFYLIIALIVGCVIGLIPAFLTGLLFKKLIKNKLTSATIAQVLMYGGLATLLWVPVILLSAIYDINLFKLLCVIYIGAIVPASLYCAFLTRKFAIHQEKSSLAHST